MSIQKPKKNPPAFPMPGHPGMNGPQEGMSLRDWFAGMALQGIEIDKLFDEYSVIENGQAHASKYVAVIAYSIADAMIARRGDE